MFNWFKKVNNNQKCLICEKIIIKNKEMYCNKESLDAVLPAEGFSKELCFPCYYNFVILKNHLRNCETTKFFFKTPKHNQPERSKREDISTSEMMRCSEHCGNTVREAQ